MLQIKITTDNIFYYFKKISIRTVNNVPTLYKPLLILYALSKVSSRQKRLLPYSTIDKELNSIIDASFITLKHRNFHYAFGRLETDGLWEVEGQEKLKKSKSGDLEKSELIAKNIKGGFTDIVYTILRNNPKILKEIYLFFLNTYFDKSIDKILLSLSEYPVFKGRKMTLISNEGEPVSRWWIQKGISTIKTDREIFSSSNMRRARLEFIAGKNRLATIKGWMLAAQIIQNGKNSKEFELSDFGFSLFENDPKLEKSASWWAFHLSVCFSEINEPYASFFTHLD
ncbi:MAG: DUF4007 family protein [Methylococcaceae bacterium]|nr:DUF4007 family protein [Methylococcaceae bacterium]